MLGLKRVRGCLGGVAFLALLLVASYVGWRWGEPIFGRVGQGGERTGPEVSEELSRRTLERFEVFRRGEAEDRFALGGTELESVLRFGIPQLVPPGVVEPYLSLSDGVLQVGGSVAVDAFPSLPDLGGVLGLLPDTLPIEVEGTIAPFDDRRAALVVHQVRALKIPLPDRLIGEILSAFGRADIPNLATDAMPIPLPQGVTSAYVLRDSLVLVRRE